MRFPWNQDASPWPVIAAAAVLAPSAETADKMGRRRTASPTRPSPLPGVMAAGQPTGEQIQLLAEEGYRTVIDLRPAAEPRGFDEPDAGEAERDSPTSISR